MVVYCSQDNSMYSLVIDMGGDKDAEGTLSFVPKVEVLGSRKLEFIPQSVITAKQRGAYRAVAYNRVAQKVHAFSQDLKEEEMVVGLQVDPGYELTLMQQTVGLLYHTKREIGFFKLIKAPPAAQKKGEESVEPQTRQLKSKPACFSNFYDIEDVVFDPVSVGSFIALSKKDNALVVFQGSGQGREI